MTSPHHVLGLLADPGVPQDLVDEMAEDIGHRLSARTDSDWGVEVSHVTFPLNDDGTVPFGRYAPQILAEHRWRYLVYLTDLPRALDKAPVTAEVDAIQHAAMVSLPSLGAMNLRRSARDLIVDLVAIGADQDIETVSEQMLLDGVDVPGLSIGHGLEPDTHYLVRSGPAARVRQVSGMVRTNRPGRLVTALTGGIAAALASGGFGVFFGSIWTLAVALPPWRHVLVAVVMILTFTFWLITRNKLWFHRHAATGSGRAAVENIATSITVLLSIITMYVLLFAALGLLGVLVIDASYLSSQLGYTSSPVDYVAITSLSVSMGLLAGALGSNFDEADAVRIATYSKRGHEQREKLAEYDESQHDGQDDGGDADARDAAAADEDAEQSAPKTSDGGSSVAPNPSADRENRP